MCTNTSNKKAFNVVIGSYVRNSDSARHAGPLTHVFQFTQTHVLIWLVRSTQFRYHFGCVKHTHTHTYIHAGDMSISLNALDFMYLIEDFRRWNNEHQTKRKIIYKTLLCAYTREKEKTE